MYLYPQRARDLFRELPEEVAWLVAVFMLINVFGGFYILRHDTVLGTAYIVGVVSAFVVHEAGHRTVSRRIGCSARFSIDLPSVVFTSLVAILQNTWLILFSRGLPFVIALPGYVLSICGLVSRWSEGLISLAGPAANIVVATVLVLLRPLTGLSTWAEALDIVARVNISLALFNLIPIPPLDGFKIVRWNILVWLLIVMTSLIVLMQV